MEHHNREVDEMTMQVQNKVLLEGVAQAAPKWSHENHHTQFYRFPLEIPRLSGTSDILPILLPEPLAAQITPGEAVRLEGQFRSFNNRSGQGNRLVLTVYGQALLPPAGESCNQILLSGALCKPPVYRRTPLGRSICDLMLAVPRRYGRADYLPVIAWGQLALETSDLSVGDFLHLEGRIQSRTYHKATENGTEERIAYEISMMHLLDETETTDSISD